MASPLEQEKVILQDIKPKIRGMLQSQLRPFLRTMTPQEARAAQAYLNPGHGDNTRDAVPLPDGTTGATFMLRNFKIFTVTVGASGKMGFYNLPFAEHPFAFKDDTGLRCVEMPAMQFESTDAASYFNKIHAYKYRCVGKSMTIVNTSTVVSKMGSVCTGRKTADIDYTTRQYAQGVAGDAVNQPIMQRLPVTQTGVSALQNGGTWSANDGAYLISHHEHHDWVVRDDFTHKCFPHPAATGAGNCLLTYTDEAGVAASTLLETGAANGAHCGPCDGTDIPIAIFEGMTAGSTFSVKCAVVYEIILKASSPLIPYTSIRPPFNPGFMNSLLKYEQVMDRSGLYPASYNGWNEIWEGFKSFWKRGGNALAKTAAELLVPGAGAAVGGIGDLLTNF